MSRPPDGRTGYRVVHLSEVPERKRRQVADRLIRLEGLVGESALDLMLAATLPVQDPFVIVPVDAARKVVGR